MLWHALLLIIVSGPVHARSWSTCLIRACGPVLIKCKWNNDNCHTPRHLRHTSWKNNPCAHWLKTWRHAILSTAVLHISLSCIIRSLFGLTFAASSCNIIVHSLRIRPTLRTYLEVDACRVSGMNPLKNKLPSRLPLRHTVAGRCSLQ